MIAAETQTPETYAAEQMTSDTISQVYLDAAVSQVPRILGLCDREPDSPTFGSFDRPYWHYQTMDFANGRLQEAGLILALLTVTEAEGNPFFASERIKEWALGAVRFWAQSQDRDGSLSEVYPREQSYVATAFSTLAMSETLQVLGSTDRSDAVERAAQWLSRNENLVVSNQVAGAIAALDSASRLTGIDQFRSAAQTKLDQLLSQQSPEGWFPEYGGFDIGYNSICLGHLALYAERSDNNDAAAAAERVAEFIDEHIREDGTYDPEPTSRRTQYVYPFGLAQIARSDILARHTQGVIENRVLQPAWMDDRFCIPLTLDYVQAYGVLQPCE